MAALEPCPLPMEGSSDLLDLADDLDCHLDLADISDDWVSLMMQEQGGLDSLPLSRDFSFSHMSCLGVEPDGSPRDNEQEHGQQQENGGHCNHDMPPAVVAESLWAGMEAGESSAHSSLFLSKNGSDCDASFQQAGASLPISRVTLSGSLSASPPSDQLCLPPGDPSRWPSSQSSFMETDACSSFFVDTDGGVDSLQDHQLDLSGSDASMSSAEVVREDPGHAAGSSCQFYDVQSLQTGVVTPVCLSSSGQADYGFSVTSSPPQVSGSSSSSRECGGNELAQEIHGDRDLGSDGSDSDSPTSSIFSAKVDDVNHCTVDSVRQQDGRGCQQPLSQKTDKVPGFSDENRLGSSASPSAVGNSGVQGKFAGLEGSNITGLDKCIASSVRDQLGAEDCQERSPVAPLRLRSATREEKVVGNGPGKEQLGKGTKRKGEDRWAPQQSGSTCSEGQHSEVSDGDKKEFGDEEDEKRQARLMRNRESAQQSRQRKKVYVDELEHKLRTMTATVAELNATIAHLTAENVNLRRQISYIYQPPPAVGARPPMMAPPLMPMGPYPGIYGMRPMIPGVPAPPVPIPRLKPQSSASKSTKKSKVSGKDEGSEKKRKRKAASAAVLGLFCFMMLIGPYSWGLPQLESGYGRGRGWGDRSSMVRPGGRVLNSWVEESEPTGFWSSLTMSRWFKYWTPSRGREEICNVTCVPSVLRRDRRPTSSDNFLRKQVPQKGVYQNRNGRNPVGVGYVRDFKARQPLQKKGLEDGELGAGSRAKQIPASSQINRVGSPVVLVGGVLLANASEPFAASLSVPRNNQLVTIEGSLIIQAIIAGDEAAKRDMDRRGNGKGKDSQDKVLAEVLGQYMGKRLDRVDVVVREVGHEVPKPVYREAAGERRHGAPNKALVRAADGAESKTVTTNQGATYNNNVLAALTTGDNFSQFVLDDVTGLGLRAGICTEIFTFDAAPHDGQVRDEPDFNSTEVSGGTQNGTTSNEGRSRRSRRDPFAIPLPPSHARASEMRNESQNGTVSADSFEGQKQKSSMVVSIFTGQGTEDETTTICNGAKGKGNLFVVVLVDGVKYVTYSCCLPTKVQPQVVAG